MADIKKWVEDPLVAVILQRFEVTEPTVKALDSVVLNSVPADRVEVFKVTVMHKGKLAGFLVVTEKP